MKSWWTTLPGLLTAVGTVITALTGAYLALTKAPDKIPNTPVVPDPCQTLPFDERPMSCLEEKK